MLQEPRASDVRTTMLQELQRWFARVERVPSDVWSSSVRGCEHIELYRASLKHPPVC
jgi:hypothetical protein